MDVGRRIGQGGTAFASSRGRICVWSIAPKLLVGKVTGYGEAAFAAPIVEGLTALATGRAMGEGGIDVFFDAFNMDAYASDLRIGMTNAFLEHRAKIVAIHGLTRSRFVAMGATVANIALGGLVHLYGSRAAFDVALEQAARASGVPSLLEAIRSA